MVDKRRLVGVEAERVTNVSSTDFPGHYPGEDHAWNLEKFQKNLKVQVMRKSQRSIEFDLVGVDASIANAFRRIMIAEVPTMCIENVYIWDNTSVIHDEVFAHRLGLVPLNVDSRIMRFREADKKEQPTDQDTIVFMLDVTCERKPDAPKGTTKPDELYVNHELKSSDFTWEPVGAQREVFTTDELIPRAINPNIVLAKLRPGQGVKMQMYAVKGVGKDHAKFSPVATASYRLLPHITIKKPIPTHLSEKFANCFSPGVIKIDPRTKQASVDEQNLRRDTVSREVLRHPEFEGCVELGRVRDHFLFSVESESSYAPEEIFAESVIIMREKIAKLRESVVWLIDKHGGAGEDVAMADGTS